MKKWKILFPSQIKIGKNEKVEWKYDISFQKLKKIK